MNRVLILSVFVVASCGLAYELIAAAMASYLLGDSVLQFSTIIGTYLFAMGIGAYASKYIADEDLLTRFVDIELFVGLLGGLSALILFTAFAWLSAPFRAMLYALVFLIGILVGTEIPLVMRVLNLAQQRFSELVSKVLSFDSLGALSVSVLFPLVLAPQLGLMRSAFLFGALNVAVGLWTLSHFRAQIKGFRGRVVRGVLVLVILCVGFVAADRLTEWSEKRLYGDDIVFATTTPYQRLVLTRWKDDLRLYINGNLQFSARDEYRYHEALVHPALAGHARPAKVLILGGGDGLALREVLKYPSVTRVVLVDIDHEMTRLFSSSASLVELNRNAYADPRVQVVNQDAAAWLEAHPLAPQDRFDVAIVDFPDPSNFSLGKLYSVPFYRMLSRRLSDEARLAIQSTSPIYAPHAYWSIEATLKAAGLSVKPYHAWVPSFGAWGFMLASKSEALLDLPKAIPVDTRYLDAREMHKLFELPPDIVRLSVRPNHLNDQILVQYFERDWSHALR